MGIMHKMEYDLNRFVFLYSSILFWGVRSKLFYGIQMG